MKRFSQRYGYEEVRSALQVGSMDKRLRNALWNCVDYAILRISAQTAFVRLSPLSQLAVEIWDGVMHTTNDQIPSEVGRLRFELKNWFMSVPWNLAYDLLECIAASGATLPEFKPQCNEMLVREGAGYRFIGNQITPLTSEAEFQEVANALKESSAPVAEHLKTALGLFSNRTEPDYRNSVKESISAVEAACRELAAKPDATLSDAIKKLPNQPHPALRFAFGKIYGYTGDQGGIRHSLDDQSVIVDEAEARFMFVACSAFVNYLRAKSKLPLT